MLKVCYVKLYLFLYESDYPPIEFDDIIKFYFSDT
jgi:hypothetical protein